METVFDSPLQTAISSLMAHVERLDELGLHSDATVVTQVLEMLQSPDLHSSKTMDQISDGEKQQVDPELQEWLHAMQWLSKGASATTAAASPEGGLVHAGSAEQDLFDEEGLLLNPCLRPLESAESEVLSLLEHGPGRWEMDMLRLHELTGGRCLQAFGWALFERHDARTTLGVSAQTAQRFLQRLEEGYLAVPYHNSCHAACVAHATNYLLTTKPEIAGVAETPLERFTAVLAALVHDLSHTGHNNAFHVATQSELAIRYNDQSVLEMHHLASAFTLLGSQDCALLAHLPPELRKEVRATAVGMVLATDLAVNFPTINAFKAMLTERSQLGCEGDKGDEPSSTATLPPTRTRRASGVPLLPGGDGESAAVPPPLFSSSSETVSPAERLLILKMLIKVADIGNVSKGREYCLAWTDRIVQEFFDQGDLERKLGMPVTPMLDRNLACIPKQQIGFYNFVVKPMFEALDLLVSMEEPLANLETMHEHWRGKLPDEDAEVALTPRAKVEASQKTTGALLSSSHGSRSSQVSRQSTRFSRSSFHLGSTTGQRGSAAPNALRLSLNPTRRASSHK